MSQLANTSGGRSVRAASDTLSKVVRTSRQARVVRSSSATASWAAMEIHCAGAMSRTWKKRSSGSTELS